MKFPEMIRSRSSLFAGLLSFLKILLAGSLPGYLFVLSASDHSRNEIEKMLPILGRLGGAVIGDRIDSGAVVGLIADFVGFLLLPIAACCSTPQPTLKPSLLLATVFYGWFVFGGYLQYEGYNVFAAPLLAPFYVGLSMIFCVPIFLVRKQAAQRSADAKSADTNLPAKADEIFWPPPPHS